MNTEIEIKGNSPAEMMLVAAKNNYTPEQIMKMLDAQERYDAIQAKKAYNQAMSDFKANPPKILKEKQVAFKDVRYKHATLADSADKIGESLSKFGLSFSWATQQKENQIGVTCRLSHTLGHFEETTLWAGADNTGSKNSIQQLGSTVTYLQRYTLFLITGLAAQDQTDDDGKHSQVVELIDEKEIAILEEYFTSLEVNVPEFMKYMGVESIQDITKQAYPKALNALKTKAQKKGKK
jgi:hypothetical protein